MLIQCHFNFKSNSIPASTVGKRSPSASMAALLGVLRLPPGSLGERLQRAEGMGTSASCSRNSGSRSSSQAPCLAALHPAPGTRSWHSSTMVEITWAGAGLSVCSNARNAIRQQERSWHGDGDNTEGLIPLVVPAPTHRGKKVGAATFSGTISQASLRMCLASLAVPIMHVVQFLRTDGRRLMQQHSRGTRLERPVHGHDRRGAVRSRGRLE